MNVIVSFKENSAKRHACAGSIVCRLLHTITIEVGGNRPQKFTDHQQQPLLEQQDQHQPVRIYC
jgi:hypothetical protein